MVIRDTVQQVSTVEQALRALLDERLASGELQPGVKLPTERQLVDILSAPRSAVRRALDSLESDGMVLRQVGRGTFLTDAAPNRRSSAPPNTSPAEIMQVRQLFEPPVAHLAAQVATQTDLDVVQSCLDSGRTATSFEQFELWDGRLHMAIARASHNGLLISMFEVLTAARALPIWGGLKRRTSTPERRQCYQAEHAAVVHALVDRDPAAAREAMAKHLQHVADGLLRQS